MYRNRTKDWLIKLAWISFLLLASYALMYAHYLMAQGIDIGGADASNQMKDVKNLVTTMQKIGFQWIAKLIGGYLVVSGVYKVACREFVSGSLATFGGGSLFFIEKIADSLSKMGGS